MTSAPGSQLTLRPEWLAHRYDEAQDSFHFVKAGRALRRAVPFLTDEHLPGAASPLAVPRTDAMAAAPAPAPVHFIFHSAYCCSTLLAAALDVPRVSTSCKEPQLLNDMVGWRHRGGAPARVSAVLDDSLRLLARPFEESEACVIKPSNIVNGLIDAIMTMRPDARCILMHAPLPAFVASIARKGMWGRLWVRELLSRQLAEGMVDLGFAPRDYLLHTDLQAAAVGWLAQHALFARIADRWPDRVRTLDSEVLVAQPAATLAAAVRFFGLDVDERTLATVVAEQFARDSKDGAAFAPGQREAMRREAETLHADEIGKVSVWAEAVGQAAGVAPELPSALRPV